MERYREPQMQLAQGICLQGMTDVQYKAPLFYDLNSHTRVGLKMQKHLSGSRIFYRDPEAFINQDITIS